MPSSYVVGSHFEQFIKDQISGGRYATASEVVRDALRLLEHEEQRRAAALSALRADVRQGLDSGPGQSAEAVFQRLEQKYSNHSALIIEP
jgi:antitoxin ParD1/3/4